MNEEIIVQTITKSLDEDGFDVEVVHEATLYCNVKSASYLDTYNAMQAGATATISFEIRKEDFDDLRILENGKHYYPSRIVWDGALYNLVRWFYNDNGRAVLVCG